MMARHSCSRDSRGCSGGAARGVERSLDNAFRGYRPVLLLADTPESPVKLWGWAKQHHPESPVDRTPASRSSSEG